MRAIWGWMYATVTRQTQEGARCFKVLKSGLWKMVTRSTALESEFREKCYPKEWEVVVTLLGDCR